MNSLKKKVCFVSLIALFMLPFVGTAGVFSNDSDENSAKRVFILSDFNAVSVSSGIDLYLQPSSKTEAVAVGSRESIDQLDISQNGGKVNIKFKKGLGMFSKRSVKIYLNYKILNDINASGGSDVYVVNNETIKTNKLKVVASGGSDFKLKIDTPSLLCYLSGGSDGKFVGVANDAEYNISGGSDVSAKDLISKTCKIEASGAADATVYVTEKITANASGGSDIYYYGNPKQRSVSASGGSDIYQK